MRFMVSKGCLGAFKSRHKPARGIRRCIERRRYDKAYVLGEKAISTTPEDQDILRALYALSAALRSEAIAFSSDKANYAKVSQYELLPVEVDKLVSQTVVRSS